MNLYRRYVLPRLIDLSMRDPKHLPYRRRCLAAAEGRVLEIGVGSGLNLPLYGASVAQVFGVDPSPALLARAGQRASGAMVPVELVPGTAEALLAESASFDYVVSTWTLCSVDRPREALAEIRRVLKPTGRLVFLEHGLAPDPGIAKWQRRLNPAWQRLSGGCRMSLPVAELIEAAGLRLERLEQGYSPGPRVLSFLYEGVACPR